MNYEKIDMGAYNLHIIKTNKFKTVTVEVNFREKIDKKYITMRNLLKAVLLNTNANFKTERKLIQETENLYDLKIISANSRIGNYSNLAFKVRFLNEKYTEESMNEYSIKFLMDVLFNPDVENNKFNDDVVEKCKKRLEKGIKSLKDNKLKYALFNLLETTKDMPYSYNSYGYIEELEKINSHNLYEYYQNVLNNNFVDIFVVGDIDTNLVKELLKTSFKVNTFKKEDRNILVPELPNNGKIKKYLKEDSANQSQLTLLCTLSELTEFERKYTLLVYNELLGGSSNSLLFDTVREKNSYAYYVNSNAKAYDNIMLIYAGIEPGNSDNVLKLIKTTLKNITRGKFEDKLLESSKKTIISSINASKDSPAGIINTYYAMKLVDSKDFEERIQNIQKITKEDIIEISKKVAIHTMYLLEGVNNEED